MNYRTTCRIRRALADGMLVLVAILMALLPAMDASLAEAADTPSVEMPIPATDDEIHFIVKWMNEAIVVICLGVGLLYKHCTPFENKYIPLLVAVVGVGSALVVHWSEGITLLVIAEGLWSGLASTGLHQMFNKLFVKTE